MKNRPLGRALIAGGVIALGALPGAIGSPMSPPEHAPAKPAPKSVERPAIKVGEKPAANEAPPRQRAARQDEPAEALADETPGEITPQRALAMLREGNERWVSGSAKAPNTESSRRQSLAANGQTPFATILTCADSRIPVERVFDRGVGDVFVLRVAGNIAGPHEAGSIEYSAEHLHVPVLVVMGHTKCGAVAAAASGAKLEGNIPSLIESIAPAVERARRLNPSADEKAFAPIAVRENVWQTIFDLLKTSGPVRELVAQGKLEVVGAVYDIADGKVEWMGPHPWQSELVAAFSKGRNPEQTADADEH